MRNMEEHMREIELSLHNVKLLLKEKVAQLKEQVSKRLSIINNLSQIEQTLRNKNLRCNFVGMVTVYKLPDISSSSPHCNFFTHMH